MSAETWRLSCPWCEYFITVSERSGAGEEAADMMVDHLGARHPGKGWKQFLDASDGYSVIALLASLERETQP